MIALLEGFVRQQSSTRPPRRCRPRAAEGDGGRSRDDPRRLARQPGPNTSPGSVATPLNSAARAANHPAEWSWVTALRTNPQVGNHASASLLAFVMTLWCQSAFAQMDMHGRVAPVATEPGWSG